MLWLTKFKKIGFSLIELIIAIGLFAMISGSLILLLNISLRITNDNKAKTSAIALAEEKIEIIKNLPYNNIGTISGVPAGNLPTSENITYNKISFNVATDIRYIDDPYDGLISTTDLLNIDYKKIKITVSWESRGKNNSLSLTTNIAPKNLEQEETGETGTLWLEVYDSTPQTIAGASIHIVNNATSPIIDLNAITDSAGKFILPGAPVATQSYEITVSKSGYSTSQTYSEDLENNPHPDPAHLSIGAEDITTKFFFIDILSNLNITSQPNFSFTLKGTKSIGADNEEQPILKYQENLIADASGNINLTNLEPDTYNISFDPAQTGYDLAGTNPLLPLIITPNTSANLALNLVPHSDHTLLITVKNPDGSGIESATVRLYKNDLSYDVSQTTTTTGQTFFTPLEQTDYNIEIIKNGYQNYLSLINIDGQKQETISLAFSI